MQAHELRELQQEYAGNSQGAVQSSHELAALVQKRASMPNRWVTNRLLMDHEVAVTGAVRRFQEDRKLAECMKALEKSWSPDEITK